MIDRTALLDALKPVLLNLEKDLRARSDAEPTIKAKLTAQYEAARASRRTAEAYSVWRDELVTQIAVAWVLGTVFIRFLEDNELLDHPWISGPGDRRTAADHQREEYFRTNKLHSDRDYVEHLFRMAAELPGLSHLFDPKHNPLWQFGPTGDAVTKLLRFWQERNPDAGVLNHDFTDPAWDTRFLGDLYQDLSEAARKRYALLQTPLFIEEFILDRTLDPAIQTFGLKGIRMIDPTCGSGHFVLGGFDRILKLWQHAEPSGPIRELAQRALDSVFGVDLNPFAVGIARFRLLIAALKAVGVLKLKGAPNFRVNLATGDSLLHGRRFREFEGHTTGTQRTFDTADVVFRDELKHHYEVEDVEALHRILGQQYHAVVGNPPYITVKDKAVSDLYRARFPSCGGKYSLSVPFMERFFDLAVKGDGTPRKPAGFVGQITANSFMKREFGKKLIQENIPRWDLTHVLDTSGAYIPGHGTPTVILFGTNQPPVRDTIRTVLGIRGEPTTPENPANGMVWQAVLRQIDRPGSESEWVSAGDSLRVKFHQHPWSIGGGGAAELKERIQGVAEKTLYDLVEVRRRKANIGFASFTGLDEAFLSDRATLRRAGVSIELIRDLIKGDIVRDWQIMPEDAALTPYDCSFEIKPLTPDAPWCRFLWYNRTVLRNTSSFETTRDAEGSSWWGWYRWIPEKYRRPLSITFAEVASHNHFALDSGGRVFKQTAPIIKLPPNATEADHLALIALLNSSTICFMMKQTSHQKQMTGGDGVRVDTKAKVPYQFGGTQLQNLPIPNAFLSGELRDRLLELGRRATESVRSLEALSSASVIQQVADGGTNHSQILSDIRKARGQIRSQMILIQEQIDFTAYVMFGLADSDILGVEIDSESLAIEVGQRPFEIVRGENIDGFSVAATVPPVWTPGVQTLWRRRIAAISQSPALKLIEEPHYKRRWIGRQGLFNHAREADEFQDAARDWLLHRIESAIGRDLHARECSKTVKAHEPKVELLTTEEILDFVVQSDFREVAEFYRGRADFDMHKLVAELIQRAAVPFLPGQRYKESGLRKRLVWEAMWDKQRSEDAIDEEVGLRAHNLTDSDRNRLEADAKMLKAKRIGDVPVPPKYANTDFRSPSYWSLRGKLDMPKERFISYPGCSRDGDPCLTVAWAGLDHLQQAKALATHYGNLQSTGADQPKLVLVLAGLNELLPWLKQWHNQLDPEFGLRMGDYYEEYVREEAKRFGKSLADLKQIAMTTT